MTKVTKPAEFKLIEQEVEIEVYENTQPSRRKVQGWVTDPPGPLAITHYPTRGTSRQFNVTHLATGKAVVGDCWRTREGARGFMKALLGLGLDWAHPEILTNDLKLQFQVKKLERFYFEP